MDFQFTLDQSYNTGITPKERNALIRFCISIGTRAKCSTHSVMRPFKQKYLLQALSEMKSKHLKTISDYEERIELCNSGKLEMSKEFIDFFDGEPKKEQVIGYYREIIKQEKDVLRSLLKSYTIPVDYSFATKKQLAFHNSLNPRITFGYSNVLHEECDFSLTDEVKSAFLVSSLSEVPEYKDDWTHDWGNVFFETVVNLLYEDLEVFAGERRILETISHERMMTVFLTDKELDLFNVFEVKKGNRCGTIQKLKATASGHEESDI